MPNPTNPQAFNRYSYVDNNPIKFNDPTGHKKHFWSRFFKIFAITIAAVAAASFAGGILGGIIGFGAGSAGIEGATSIVINQGIQGATWAAGAIAAAGAGNAIGFNQATEKNRQNRSFATNGAAVEKMIERFSTGLAGAAPPSMLTNLPNYGTMDTPGLGGVGVASTQALQKAMEINKSASVNPQEPMRRDNRPRRKEPKSLSEKLFMDEVLDQAKKNPKEPPGSKVYNLGEMTEFPGMEKWKVERADSNGNMMEVHYNINPYTGEIADAKYIERSR